MWCRSMTPRCDAPVSDADLLDYWIQAMPEMDAGQIEQILFSCGECTARLDAMASLGAALSAVARLVRVHGHRLAGSAESAAARRRARLPDVFGVAWRTGPVRGVPGRTICWSFPCVSTLRDWKW